MMRQTERNKHESFPSNLHDDNLQDKDGHHNSNEQVIIEEILKDISLLFLQLSRIEEVKHLQVHKDIEEKSQMLA